MSWQVPQSFDVSPSGSPSVISTSLCPPPPVRRVRQSTPPQSFANTDPVLARNEISSAGLDPNTLVWERSSGIINESQNLRAERNLSTDRGTANFLGHSPSPLDDPSIHSTPRNQNIYSDSTSLGDHSSPATTSKDHTHWCTICENPGIIKTCDGYKRHMREHETQYYCIPQESVVESRDGPKCAVCGVFNPDPKHLNTHNVPECRHKFFKRKKLLTEHYEEHHGIDDGSLLADQSKHTTHKTCFPCGFCASPFDSLNEQINHIDAVHYRLSEHISGWDPNKVIRGLLSQPGVSEHWRSALAANPGCQESLFTWHPKIVQNLKHRLEMSQEPPGVLCRVAIAESNYGGTELHHVGSMQAASLTGSAMNTSQSIRKPQHRTGLSPLPPVSESGSTTHFPQAVASTIHSQRPTLSWNGPYDSDLCAVYEDQPAPQIASKTLKSSSSATYHDANNRTQPHATPSNAESFTQPHHPAFAPLIMSASSNLQAFEGQVGAPHSSRSSSQSQGMSSSITTNPYSRQVAEAHTYPAQARMGYLHPPMETQSAASPLSRNHPISQSGQINSSFNSRAQSKFAAQHSHQETIDNTNVDSDNTQRPGHDQAQFRDQRQYH